MVTPGDIADARVQGEEAALRGGQEHVVRVVAPLRSEAVAHRAQGSARDAAAPQARAVRQDAPNGDHGGVPGT
eukprot:4207286-Alexandrium_andersonii.AAC.1